MKIGIKIQIYCKSEALELLSSRNIRLKHLISYKV